jgi:hypothetical protein
MKHKFFQLTSKSFEELGVKTYKELWEKAQGDGYTALQLGLGVVFVKAEGAENKFHAVLSDALEDRHSDIVEQEWVLSNFKKNPVLLDSHDYSSIEKIIGRWLNIGVKDKKLQGDVEFALMNPRGVLAQQMAIGGFLNALSAGFIPLEFDQKTGNITKSELLEGSMVSVPANPRTLLEKDIEGKKEDDEQEDTKDDDTIEVKEVEPPMVPATAVTPKKSILVALNEKLKSQEQVMRAVAAELKGATPENINEKKRRMWKALRVAI